MLAGHLHGGFGRRKFLHLPGVVFGEIDGFADVSVGFRPSLSGFDDQPGVKIEFSFADQRGGADHEFDTAFDGDAAPFREVGVGVFNGAGG